MKKIIVLSLLILLPLKAVASSTPYLLMTTNMLMTSAIINSQKTSTKAQEKFQRCLEYGGGKACYEKYKVKK